MVTGLLNNAGWHVNHKRVERIWRREGLKVPQKQKSALLMHHWFEHNGARTAMAEGGANPDRAVAYPLQHGQAAQLIGLPSARARKHRPDGPKADDALTIKPDHPMGACHTQRNRTHTLFNALKEQKPD